MSLDPTKAKEERDKLIQSVAHFAEQCAKNKDKKSAERLALRLDQAKRALGLHMALKDQKIVALKASIIALEAELEDARAAPLLGRMEDGLAAPLLENVEDSLAAPPPRNVEDDSGTPLLGSDVVVLENVSGGTDEENAIASGELGLEHIGHVALMEARTVRILVAAGCPVTATQSVARLDVGTVTRLSEGIAGAVGHSGFLVNEAGLLYSLPVAFGLGSPPRFSAGSGAWRRTSYAASQEELRATEAWVGSWDCGVE
ncbi:unnamed protein product [Symbiodinium sp. KB8]|nr:unnamed protein product [Symbiodinium sp. KB8]